MAKEENVKAEDRQDDAEKKNENMSEKAIKFFIERDIIAENSK